MYYDTKTYMLFALILGLGTLAACDSPLENSSVDAVELWRKTKKPYREGIAKRIVNGGILVGLTRQQVEQLLGPADASNQYGKGEWCFEIGENGLDVMWLRVDFADDRVSSVRIAAD